MLDTTMLTTTTVMLNVVSDSEARHNTARCHNARHEYNAVSDGASNDRQCEWGQGSTKMLIFIVQGGGGVGASLRFNTSINVEALHRRISVTVQRLQADSTTEVATAVHHDAGAR